MREQFVRAICDDPEDLTPRLVYADWLDENGDPSQAEFIRVQIEMGKMTACHRGPTELYGYPLRFDGQADCECDWHKLWKRSEALHPRRDPGFPFFHSFYSNGFVEAVITSMATWLLHSQAFVRQNPVRRVAFRDMFPQKRELRAVQITGNFCAWERQEYFDTPHSVAEPIWSYLRPEGPEVRLSIYDTSKKALSALSEACVRWARADVNVVSPGPV